MFVPETLGLGMEDECLVGNRQDESRVPRPQTVVVLLAVTMRECLFIQIPDGLDPPIDQMT